MKRARGKVKNKITPRNFIFKNDCFENKNQIKVKTREATTSKKEAGEKLIRKDNKPIIAPNLIITAFFDKEIILSKLSETIKIINKAII